MKNIIKYGIFALMSAFIFASCNPQDDTDYELGSSPTSDELSFTATPTSEKANVLSFENTSSRSGVVTWDFGNGITAKGQVAKGAYPYKGEYTVTMTLYTTGGSVTTKKNITIVNDDLSLLDTPIYNALTGGASKLEGKTWVFDQYQAAHFGVFPDNNAWSWYAGPNVKEGSSLYTQEFTFIQVGVKMKWKNNGYVYTNSFGVAALAKLGYTHAVATPVDDYDVEYAPKAEYTFLMNELDMTITLSDGAFFGHYAGTSTYKIIKLTDDVLELQCPSAFEIGNNWVYRFIPKEKNIKPEIPLRAVALKDDFEGAKPTVAFVGEDMGSLFSQSYQNPAPVPVNQSPKVCLYQKTSAFYSNLSYIADGYKFDLSEINKVRMKVFIPSYNDYNTTFPVAGDWISINKLQSQVVVKLQDSSNGSPWETQKEIVKANLEKDKWLDLEFDFSSVSSNVNYDKIIIQFGAEGHAAPGIFFFDDFSFNK